jgi:hypothetical protein
VDTYAGTLAGGSELFPVHVLDPHCNGVGVSMKPMKDAGAGPSVGEFSFHQLAPQ